MNISIILKFELSFLKPIHTLRVNISEYLGLIKSKVNMLFSNITANDDKQKFYNLKSFKYQPRPCETRQKPVVQKKLKYHVSYLIHLEKNFSSYY